MGDATFQEYASTIPRVANTPIPLRMQQLEKDHRGYPIFWSVYRDKSGKPHFQINDESKRIQALNTKFCPICGQTLEIMCVFVGGPQSAFHKLGAYNDPGMHPECAEYALKVCPYLAAPSYAGEVGTKTLDPANVEEHRIFVDFTADPNRPKVFVAVWSHGYSIRANLRNGRNAPSLHPVRPYRRVEYWVAGQQISRGEGHRLSYLAGLSRPTIVKCGG
jgi:hypothetical protein